MNYVQRLCDQNITFNVICEKDAENIMKKEYSYYKLMEYSQLFEKYKTTSKQGKFVKLDFSQLYYLAVIDFRLSQILMCMCLEIENVLKTKLISDADKVSDNQNFFREYYNSESSYFKQTYNAENIEILRMSDFEGTVDSLELPQFLNVLQFGTLEKLIHFFYKKYAVQIYKTEFAPFENELYSIRRIRNLVAHNNSILSKLNIKTEHRNLKLSAYLGKKGIKNKTLTTNLSKIIVSDLCNLLYVYFNIIEDNNAVLRMLEEFDKQCWQKYQGYFEENYSLKSVYFFIKKIILIMIDK